MATSTDDELINNYNTAIASWIKCCDDHSINMLRRKPTPDSWSLGQMIRHIILDTTFHIGQMKLALTDLQFTDRVMHHDGIEMLQRNEFPDMLITGHPDNALIAQPQSLQELVDALRDLQIELEQLYSTFDFNASTGKSEHPGLGFFTAKEWLQFTEMHMRHHVRQKKRIDEYLQQIS